MWDVLGSFRHRSTRSALSRFWTLVVRWSQSAKPSLIDSMFSGKVTLFCRQMTFGQLSRWNNGAGQLLALTDLQSESIRYMKVVDSLATHTIPDMRLVELVSLTILQAGCQALQPYGTGRDINILPKHSQLAESQRARERETHFPPPSSPLTLPSSSPPTHHHHHHHHPPCPFWLMLPLFFVALCQTTGIVGVVGYACNRFAAHVQQFHVPLFVVFSTSVFVGHVCRCTLSHLFQPGMRCVPAENNSKGLVFVGFLRSRVTM